MRSKYKLLITLGIISILLISGYGLFRAYLMSSSLAHQLLTPTASVPPLVDNSPESPAPLPPEAFADQIHVISSRQIKTLKQSEITRAQQSYWNTTATPSATTMDVFHISYTAPTTMQNGKHSTINAQVFVPLTPQPLPAIVYGSGTTGISPHCAPSLEDISKANIGNYFNQMVALASLGYVVIFPDYEGYGSPNSTHPYFVAELEARALVSSLIAADAVLTTVREIHPMNKDQIFYMGYSQGGHAALAAAAHDELLPDTFEVSGLVGYAPALDLKGLLIDSPRLAPYLVYAYQQYYNITSQHVNSILAPELYQNLEKDVTTHCVDSIYSHYPAAASAMYSPDFLTALVTNSLDHQAPEFAHYLELNQGTNLVTDKPLLIIQGLKDTIVTPKTQKAAFDHLCLNSIPITYTNLASASHFQTPAQGVFVAHNWMQQVMTGQTPRNDCSSSTSE
jgi:dienelactone hydrolase